MTRKFLHIILFFLLHASLFAQFEVYGGLNFGTLKNSSFNQFAESYNSYNSATVQKPLKGFATGSGFNLGVSFFILKDKLGFSLSTINYKGRSHAKLDYGERYFEMRFTPVNFGVPVRAERFTFHPKFGCGRTMMASWFEYPDGSKSFGAEKLLNGMYHGFGFSFDVSLEVLLLRFGPLTVDLCGAVGGMSSIYEASEGSWARGLAAIYYPSGLPLDYAQWNATTNAGNYTDYNGGYVHNKGLYFNAFINVRFTTSEN